MKETRQTAYVQRNTKGRSCDRAVSVAYCKCVCSCRYPACTAIDCFGERTASKWTRSTANVAVLSGLPYLNTSINPPSGVLLGGGKVGNRTPFA